MVIPLILLAIMSAVLAAENYILLRRARSINLRISVSGTRGKSSVTRDIASVLRNSGMKVLAKTTGSEPVYIYPDGTEEPVKRRGLVSISEQKKLVAMAAALKADCIVSEIMSIRPDNHMIESRRIIRPHITILTNFRADHLDVSGSSREDTEALFLNDIYPGSAVFVHSKHTPETIIEDIKALGSSINVVKEGISYQLPADKDSLRFRVGDNLDLVTAVSRHLSVDDRIIAKGLETARHDTGRAELFTLTRNNKTVWFASTFAANDPLSTSLIIDIIIRDSGLEPRHMAGILSLRSDRAERTAQWIEYLKSDGSSLFNHIFITGSHKHLAGRQIRESSVLKHTEPTEITNYIFERSNDKTIVVGLANIAGTGRLLAEYWRREL